MLAAAAGWAAVAAELESAAGATRLGDLRVDRADVVGSVVDGDGGRGNTVCGWLQARPLQAEQTGCQAYAAAAAYEAAFAMTVPPPVIAANRALLMALIATNFFGQNTAAIAATEAQYVQMWVQDATAMYGYAADSVSREHLHLVQRAVGDHRTRRGEADQAAGGGPVRRQYRQHPHPIGDAARVARRTAPTTNTPIVEPVAPGQTVTAPAGSTVTLGTNSALILNSGSITIDAGVRVGSSAGFVTLSPGSPCSPRLKPSRHHLIPAQTTVTAGASPITLTPGLTGNITVNLISGPSTINGFCR